MNRKILSLILFVIIATFTLNPIFSSQIAKTKPIIPLNNDQYHFNNMSVNQKKIKLGIYHIKEDGSANFTIKELSLFDYESLVHEITQMISQTKTSDKPFEIVLEKLKGIKHKSKRHKQLSLHKRNF